MPETYMKLCFFLLPLSSQLSKDSDMQGKKFISPGAWFSMLYPAAWNEFEDSEEAFLFYNPDVWTGNFRISAYRGRSGYGRECVQQELRQNPSASLRKVGALECAYSREAFRENDVPYVTHFWVIGIDDVAFECSFTVHEGGDIGEAESVIATLQVRDPARKYPAEIIPVRLSEIYQIDEAYEQLSSMVRTELKRDFQGKEEDLDSLQQLVDNGTIAAKKRDGWLALGITICVILANEVEGMEWHTLVDGNREAPVLCYRGHTIDPMKLAWSEIKAGRTCNVSEAYQAALATGN